MAIFFALGLFVWGIPSSLDCGGAAVRRLLAYACPLAGDTLLKASTLERFSQSVRHTRHSARGPDGFACGLVMYQAHLGMISGAEVAEGLNSSLLVFIAKTSLGALG